MFESLFQTDPAIARSFQMELHRQEEGLELIASENFVSPAIMEVMGSPLTNKYAEGYPKARYYGGCHFYDEIESLAIERAKAIFGAEHANVQPHSGAQANQAVYLAFLQPGDTILTMELAHGGHLTHGSPVNSSGKLYKVVHYRVRKEDERLDYDDIEAKAKEHRPKLIVCGASAYPRQIDFARFREIADGVGALLMADIAHIAGLVAARLHPDPIPYCDIVTTTTHKTLRGPRGGLILTSEKHKKAINSAVFPGTQGGPLMHVIAAKAVAFGEALQATFGVYQKQILENAQALAETLKGRGLRLVTDGTDNHLILMDVGSLKLTGQICEVALEEAGMTVNKNMIPYDPNPPRVTSGIRVGTPALTTRGMGVAEMRQIGMWICDVFEHHDQPDKKAQIREGIRDLCRRFPLYPGWVAEADRLGGRDKG